MNDARPLVRVRLTGIPVELHRRAGEHQEGLRRELAFVEHAQAADAAPVRLQALTAELAERYDGLTRTQTDRMTAAIEAGEDAIDLDYDLPADVVVEDAIDLRDLLDELDQFCRDGDLLTLVTPPELLAYRLWFLGEFVAQVRDGRTPQPWVAPTGCDDDLVPTRDGGAERAVRIAVHEDLDLGTASALRHQFVAQTEAGVHRITLDLSGCDFLDSTGLSLLVTTHHRLVQEGGGLRIEGASGQVLGILDMAGVTEFFGRG